MSRNATAGNRWRYTLLIGLLLSTAALVLSLPPIPQDPAYHDFADKRALLGIPNALDVSSNLPFLLVGLIGLRFCLRTEVGPMQTAWRVFFVGVALVSVGSAYYHWNPSSPTLVWDRLPMTVAFMGIFVALLGECLQTGLARKLLVPAIALGALSIAVWARTDDLRMYAWVQFAPLVILPVVLVMFRSPYSHQHLLMVALAWYVAAKLAEFLDQGIYQTMGGMVSGHTLKHLCAAATCCSIYLFLKKRRRS